MTDAPDPGAMHDDYPATADLKRLTNGDVPSGSMVVRGTILAGTLTLLVAVVGLFIAWRDADSEYDAAAELLQCPRYSAVAFDAALGGGVALVVDIQVELATAVAAIVDDDGPGLAVSSARLGELVKTSEVLVRHLHEAVALREESLVACDSTPTGSTVPAAPTVPVPSSTP